MSKRGVGGPLRLLGVMGLVFATLVVAGCCLVTPLSQMDAGGRESSEIGPVDAIPIVVTLAADEGEPLAAVMTRVLAQLQSAMAPDAFAAIRTYEALPALALSATPEVLALLLTLTDVRSVEADRTLAPL